ncbi:MAG: protein kinase [Balneolaceae bacterium]|nr:protein kinase [Balneolaceae bacterium]
MDKKTWQYIEEILDKTFELDETEALNFIESEVHDELLKKEIIALLLAEKAAPDFLDSGIDGLLTSNQAIQNIADSFKNHHVEIDRYQISEEIGRGGMSVVYRAKRTDGEFEREVAIKIMQPFGIDREDRFRRLRDERQILASLNHPNIAKVFDGGVTPEGWPYMVMELVDGAPFIDYCNKQNLNLIDRLNLFTSVCKAVNYAHQNLILHRDLKPGNILVTNDGRVKLLDFGIAKLLDEGGSAVPLTRTGIPLLTPEYAAPEQFQNEPPSTSLDIYSLGVILYELLAGTRPFDLNNKSYFEITNIIREKAPAKPSEKSCIKKISPSDLRGDLDTICMKALRKEPNERYGSVQELLDDITRYCSGLPVRARPATRSYRLKKFVGRHRTGAAASLVFLLFLFSFIALLIYQQSITSLERDRAVSLTEQLQAELDRSNTLRNFLVDLFSANIPDRPSDEIPSTEELLEIGVEKALDPESGSDAIRADMLTVIGSIYEPLNRLERAIELTEKAIEIAESDTDKNRKQLIAAYRLHSKILLRQREFLQSETSLFKAQELLAPDERTGEDDLRLMLDLARIRMHHGEYDEAKKMLLPFVDQAKSGKTYSPALITRLLWDMGIVYNLTDELEKSLEIRTFLNTHTKNIHGTTNLNYIVSLANTALVQIKLGRFTDGEESLAEVFNLYDEIFKEKPSEYRAAALNTLARLQKYRGDFDEALVTARLSSEEWAAARELDNLDDYVWLHFGQAQVLMASQNWERAESVLTHTENLFLSSETVMYGNLTWVEASLAQIHCNRGNSNSGIEMIQKINNRLEESETDYMTTDYHLALYEAEGICAESMGQFQDAISAFNRALALPIPAGQFADIARLNIHLARVTAAAGQFEFAMNHLEEAERELLKHAPTDHPYTALLEETHSELSAISVQDIN